MTEEELILTSVLKCRRIDLYAQELALSENERNMISAIETRRQAKEPLQYILNTCEFMGLDFFVDHRVLIPRPETELLAQAVCDHMIGNPKKNLRVLDIGTGSGNIIISLAKRFPQNEFYAIDASSDALAVAKMNAQKHHVAGRIDFLKVDFLFDGDFFSREEKFDIIISNPPYIRTGELSVLQQEVQQEPRIALDGGGDGLCFYRRIALASPQLLTPDGILFLEIGQGQDEEVGGILSTLGGLRVEECIKDYSQIKRIMIAQRN